MYYEVTAYPYAVTYGSINVPDDIEDVREYISEHWDEIEFGQPVLDYCGTDFECYEEAF